MTKEAPVHLMTPIGGTQCGKTGARRSSADIGNVTCRKCLKQHEAICEAQEEPVTPVIFRRFPKDRCRDLSGRVYWEGGDVVAIFPTLPGTRQEYTCESYEHLGQHCACDGRGFVNRTILAKPEEYADLKKELESPPYNYRFRVYTRWQPGFDVARREALKATGGAGSYA